MFTPPLLLTSICLELIIFFSYLFNFPYIYQWFRSNFSQFSKSFVKMFKCIRYPINFIFLMEFLRDPLPCSSMDGLSYMLESSILRSPFMNIMVTTFISLFVRNTGFGLPVFLSSFAPSFWQNSASSHFLREGNKENIFFRTCLPEIYLFYRKS